MLHNHVAMATILNEAVGWFLRTQVFNTDLYKVDAKHYTIKGMINLVIQCSVHLIPMKIQNT